MLSMNLSALPIACLLVAASAPYAAAENLLKNGSFEEPPVEGRGPVRGGATPAGIGDESSFTQFLSMDRSGKVAAGMTNELARTGKQSIFVEFNGAEKTKGALLMTDLIPIKPGEKYRISIWGRTDAKKPLTLDQGRPYMQVEMEFYPEDQASRIGETEFRTQMIPGMTDRLLFISSKWSEYYTDIRAPRRAEFLKLTFHWQSPKREGSATGIIYFDDAAVDGPAGRLQPSYDPPEPTEESKGDAKPATTPATEAAPPAKPAQPQ
jgi:hypothetical protein